MISNTVIKPSPFKSAVDKSGSILPKTIFTTAITSNIFKIESPLASPSNEPLTANITGRVALPPFDCILY